MTRRLLIIVAVLLVSSLVYADDASHRKACEDMMKMWKIDKMLGPMFDQVKKMQEDMVGKMKIPDDMKDINSKYLNKMNEMIKKEMSWDGMKEDFIGIYMEVFSESEIREMIDFYNSPIGKKSIEKAPELMQKVFSMSQNRVKRFMPEIERLSNEMAEEIKQRKQTGK